jgi:hypothetical protein
MNVKNDRLVTLLIAVPFLLLLTSCAAGDPKFTQDAPAGFLYGLWHGMIALITLVIHIFNENVAFYEVHNTGGWYDFGFMMGVTCIWGGGSHMSCKSTAKKKCEKEWEEIGEKVESKVMRKLKGWAEDEESSESGKEWEDICGKVESKLKRKIREWAEKD